MYNCVLCSGAAGACFEGEVSCALLHVYRLRGNPAPLPGPQPCQTLLTGGEEEALDEWEAHTAHTYNLFIVTTLAFNYQAVDLNCLFRHFRYNCPSYHVAFIISDLIFQGPH